MSASVIEIYPRVFLADKKQRVFVKASEDIELKIKIQPMEQYTIRHTALYRIDEEDRYPYLELQKSDTGVYFVDFDFTGEQRYTVSVASSEKVIFNGYLYSLSEDLAALKAYKGDTHLHSCRSDGEGTPFEVGCSYRRAGFDFIAVTDHHKYAPSLEAKAALEALTEEFHVFRGEEVHNKSMGHFHIINFDGEKSINDIIETDDEYVEGEIEKILASYDLSGLFDPRGMAYRIFVANEIRNAGGVAIMAHPYWDVYGEYHMQTEEVRYLWKHGFYDALEVIAACDRTGNGSNLQEALWADMRAEGIRIPVVGASDAHTTNLSRPDALFNRQFSIVFARDFNEVKTAIKDERSVAIERRSDGDFRAVGSFRFVKYARFLMAEFYPTYSTLTARHAEALAAANGKPTESIREAEAAIKEFKEKFFAV